VIVYIVKTFCQISSIISLNLVLFCQSQLITTAKLVCIEIMSRYINLKLIMYIDSFLEVTCKRY
jgi:hypothetical protein